MVRTYKGETERNIREEILLSDQIEIAVGNVFRKDRQIIDKLVLIVRTFFLLRNVQKTKVRQGEKTLQTEMNLTGTVNVKVLKVTDTVRDLGRQQKKTPVEVLVSRVRHKVKEERQTLRDSHIRDENRITEI